MKIFLYILVILSIASFQPARTVQIKAGRQLDELILKNSTVQTAINKYGKNTGFTQGIACGDHDYYINRFSFYKQGITVVTETMDNEDIKTSIIKRINISYPCNAETEEGVNLLRDNIDKILIVYGKPERTDTSKSTIEIHYYSKGISFKCGKKQKKNQGIEIYLPNTSPDFWY